MRYHVGDKIKIAGTSYQVVGIGSTPDYDAPYRNLSDSSVESSQFGTAFVTADAYETLQGSGQSEKAEQYQYAYRLNGKMTDDVFKEKVKKLAFTPEEVEESVFYRVLGQNRRKKRGYGKRHPGSFYGRGRIKRCACGAVSAQ